MLRARENHLRMINGGVQMQLGYWLRRPRGNPPYAGVGRVEFGVAAASGKSPVAGRQSEAAP